MKAGGVLLVIAIALIVIAFGVAFGLTKESATSAPPAMAQVSQALPEAEAEEVPAVVALWRKRGCKHGHNWKSAKRGVRFVLRNHRPYVKKQRVQHYKRCVNTPKQARRIRRFAKASWEWRQQYEHLWQIRFNSLPSWQQSWAISTGACESGNSPTIATGNGFYGAHQWMLSTWGSAVRLFGGGWPSMPTQASYAHQAYVAVKWMLYTSDEQWPVCGD